MSSLSEAHTLWGEARNSLPLLQAHSWYTSWDLEDAGLFDVLAIGMRGIITELASNFTEPTSELKEMSFRAMALILPPLDSMWMLLGPLIDRVLVEDSNLKVDVDGIR